MVTIASKLVSKKRFHFLKKKNSIIEQSNKKNNPQRNTNVSRNKKMIHEKMLKWKEKKEQNKSKALRQVNGCQFLKREFYGVIKMMSVFPNFFGG